MQNILFVCSGNTCRSPMAQALLQQKIGQAQYQEFFTVSSAGTGAMEGEPASSHAQLVMRGMGLDLSKHRSRQLQPEHIETAALVLTMTAAHKQLALRLEPTAREKIFTLPEFSNGYIGQGILDPYGGDLNIYRHCAAEMDQLLGLAWQKIIELAGK